MRKSLFLLSSFLILALVLVPFISADFWSWITGKVAEPTNVSITVSAIAVDWVSVITDQEITESGKTDVIFYFTASIPGGDVNDINDSNARANFTKAGQATRENLTCINISDIDADTANYSCTIGFWYFDGAGNWTITAAISDVNDNWAENDSTNVTLNESTGLTISPSELQWDIVVPGATNKTSNNDPSLLNNTANKNILVNNIEVRALDLYDQDTQAYFINSSNFTVDVETGNSCTGEDCIECDGSQLANASYQTITGANLSAGNNSLNYGNSTSGQEKLYYCLVDIPSDLPAKTYSTVHLGSWNIQII